MVSKPSDSSKSTKLHGEQASGDLRMLTCKINQLKKHIQAERVVFIKEKVEKNRKRLENDVSQLLLSATSRTDDSSMEKSGTGEMLSSRIKDPVCTLIGPAQGPGDKDNARTHEVAIPLSAKLPVVEKIPPYTTWIFLDRNQRMSEDQSVVAKQRIYYDQHGSEALICSDTDEEIGEPDKEKYEFSEAEIRIIRMVSQDYEPEEEVLKVLTQFVGGTTSEIHEVYNTLKEKENEKLNQNVSVEVDHSRSILLDKTLGASLDPLDDLFCRRCLVFDCRLHGYSQTVITPTERPYHPPESQEDRKPCSDQCYLQFQAMENCPQSLGVLSNSESRNSEKCPDKVSFNGANPDTGKRKKQTTTMLEEPKHVIDDLQESSSKKQRTSSTTRTVSMEIKDTQALDEKLNDKKSMDLEDKGETKGTTEVTALKDTSNSVVIQAEDSQSKCRWKPLEKELYLKGLEIFGRNSCLIARNLLSGLKTCIEVSGFMYDSGSTMSQRSSTAFSMSDNAGVYHKEQDTPSRSRRKGRTRKLKYSRKSAGHPSIWRRIADGKNQSCQQYIPCGCKFMCGKECPCIDNATCCEKYCGCSKSCKNRFRGCHCAKSQCRSRQCPCFAAGRECDPDVCRNCWISCGDGSLVDESPRRAEGQCGNMRLLLKQQQRILLAKSDVAGWGAFLKNSVNKNDYLGEYTGELISHREADKRGKIYDRANSSFLFDLNDQYVLDAYRKGDKLKFANHSSNPNCYAKVMLVAGDHRVGIFANEPIEAGEELFYDYRYGPDQQPIWARKPDGLKGENFSVPKGRAKKHQSHR